MSTPKPGSWIKPPVLEAVVEGASLIEKDAPIKELSVDKKSFILRPHLTNQPLKNNSKLEELKTSIESNLKEGQ